LKGGGPDVLTEREQQVVELVIAVGSVALAVVIAIELAEIVSRVW